MTKTRPKHGQPWPIGAFFLTWKTGEDAQRAIHYQGRVLAFDGTTLWGELYSWMDSGANGIRLVPQDDITFYTSDREMRSASFEFNRYRLNYIGSFEECELFPEARPNSWTDPLPDGFGAPA